MISLNAPSLKDLKAPSVSEVISSTRPSTQPSNRPSAKQFVALSQLSELLNRFSATDIAFPAKTSGLYTDLAIAEYSLRLYALVWATEALSESELSLFLMLEPIEGSYLPLGTRLTVKENNLLLAEPNLRWTNFPTYLYTQVFGSWEEKFTVEILLPNARPFELPPLTFKPD